MKEVKNSSAGWQMGGLQGMSRPPLCRPTHPYIRKPLALRGLNFNGTLVSEKCTWKSDKLQLFLLVRWTFNWIWASRPVVFRALCIVLISSCHTLWCFVFLSDIFQKVLIIYYFSDGIFLHASIFKLFG
jgi:hypothetical protein